MYTKPSVEWMQPLQRAMQADKQQSFGAVDKAAELSRSGGMRHTSGQIWFWLDQMDMANIQATGTALGT